MASYKEVILVSGFGYLGGVIPPLVYRPTDEKEIMFLALAFGGTCLGAAIGLGISRLFGNDENSDILAHEKINAQIPRTPVGARGASDTESRREQTRIERSGGNGRQARGRGRYLRGIARNLQEFLQNRANSIERFGKVREAARQLGTISETTHIIHSAKDWFKALRTGLVVMIFFAVIGTMAYIVPARFSEDYRGKFDLVLALLPLQALSTYSMVWNLSREYYINDVEMIIIFNRSMLIYALLAIITIFWLPLLWALIIACVVVCLFVFLSGGQLI
jgi:hypothetical protein